MKKKSKKFKEFDKQVQFLIAKQVEFVSKLNQSSTDGEDNEIFEETIKSIINVDSASIDQIKEKINKRMRLIEQIKEKINERMRLIEQRKTGLKSCFRIDGEIIKLIPNSFDTIQEISKKYNPQIEELFKVIKEKINAVFFEQRKKSIELEEELAALKVERYSLTEQLKQKDEIIEPGEL